MNALTIILISITLAGIALAMLRHYLRLMRLSARTEEAWHDVELLFTKRYTLIPFIADTVQRYARAERKLYRQLVVTKERTRRVVGVQARVAAERSMQMALQDVLALIDKYPQLEARDDVRELRRELTSLELQLKLAASMYNRSVAAFNRNRRFSPARLIAGLTGRRRSRELHAVELS